MVKPARQSAELAAETYGFRRSWNGTPNVLDATQDDSRACSRRVEPAYQDSVSAFSHLLPLQTLPVEALVACLCKVDAVTLCIHFMLQHPCPLRLSHGANLRENCLPSIHVPGKALAPTHKQRQVAGWGRGARRWHLVAAKQDVGARLQQYRERREVSHNTP